MTSFFPITATVTIESYVNPGNFIYVENKKTGGVKYGLYNGKNQNNYWNLLRHDQDLAVPDIDYRTYRFSLPNNDQYFLNATAKGKIDGATDYSFGAFWVVDPIALRAGDGVDEDSDGRGYHSVICTIQNFWERRNKYLAVNGENKLEFAASSELHNDWWIIASTNLNVPLRHKLYFIDDSGSVGPLMGTNDPGVFD